MHLLSIVSLYLADTDCATLREIAGAHAIDCARWRAVLSNAHKRRLWCSLAQLRPIHDKAGLTLYAPYFASSSTMYNGSRVTYYTEFSPRRPSGLDIRHVCECTDCSRCGKLDKNTRQLSNFIAHTLESYARFRSPSGNYQVVEICDISTEYTFVLSMLLPCEMLVRSCGPRGEMKITTRWKEFIHQQPSKRHCAVH
jgi:hypothetical protein